MWSGPRNLSTAMMRSFENRADCVVWDEPFYAAYLQRTGVAHPMQAEVIAAGEVDPAKVIARCVGEDADEDLGGARLHYQKHMTHHMLPEIDRGWIDRVANVFLVRDPLRVAASYAAKREIADLRDIGFVEQKELFDQVCNRLGAPPPVVDAGDIRTAPEAMLTKLCAAIGVAFEPVMLSWPAGPRDSDGAWAPHWYDAVNRSTEFAPPETGAPPQLPDAARRLADLARPYYEAMRRHAITVTA
ncbi:MAG: HAD family hydrolase [Rhodobacteraceae bacterium]|nr:HAD family hydrolase [Paracoccaceae bacterium]